VIEAEQDVLDAVRTIGGEHRERPTRGRDLGPGSRRPHERGRLCAAREPHAHEHVRDRPLEAWEGDARAGDARAGGLDDAALDERVGEALQRGRADVVQRVGQHERDGQGHAGEHRNPPQDAVSARRRLVDLEIRGAGVVCFGARDGCQREEQRERQDARGGLHRSARAHGAAIACAPPGAIGTVTARSFGSTIS
jgi:hypothetical protein